MTFSRSLLGIVIAAAVSAVLPSVRAESADPRAITITVPNERVVRYNLAAGGISPCIGLPANVPVLAMGVELTLNFGEWAKSLSSVSPGSFVEWVDLESHAGAAITQGFSGLTGTHIVYLDFSHQVDIELCGPSSIQVHNSSTGGRSGRVSRI